MFVEFEHLVGIAFFQNIELRIGFVHIETCVPMSLFFTQTESKRLFEAIKTLLFVVLKVYQLGVKAKKVKKPCKFFIWIDDFIVTIDYVNGSRAKVLLIILYCRVVVSYLK